MNAALEIIKLVEQSLTNEWQSSVKRPLNENIDHCKVDDTIDKEDYILKKMICKMPGDSKTFSMDSAYNRNGSYIGDEKTAKFLTKKKGISPVKARSNCNVCSIGFCEKDQKWYGWSHRAIIGFGIGDKLFTGSCPTENTPYIKCGKTTIKSLDQAKLAAVNFADYVS